MSKIPICSVNEKHTAGFPISYFGEGRRIRIRRSETCCVSYLCSWDCPPEAWLHLSLCHSEISHFFHLSVMLLANLLLWDFTRSLDDFNAVHTLYFLYNRIHIYASWICDSFPLFILSILFIQNRVAVYSLPIPGIPNFQTICAFSL